MKTQPLSSLKPMTLTALLRSATIFAGTLLATSAFAGQAPYSHGDPSALEQQMLELVNRSRLNPAQEGIILDTVNTWYSVAARTQSPAFFTSLRTEFASYPAVAPLAFHPQLLQSARAHSQDMITNHYFAHVNLAGKDPTARAAAAGYTSGVGENLAGSGASNGDDIFQSHFDLMVDYNNIDASHPLGHRYNVLDSSYSEIGIGVAGPRSGGMITQDFGAPARSYILGAAYQDTNANGRYDAGEGMAGITVTPESGNWFAVTSTSGGFAIPVDSVETVTDTVNVPFAVQTTPWASVLPYDSAYRQQQLAAAPTMTVNLTWSGGSLASPITTAVTMKRPVLRNYKLLGTDGWYYNLSMVTSQNAKADLTPATASITPPAVSAPLRDFDGDGKADLLFQNNIGQIAVWHMDGNGSRTSSAFLTTSALGDWKVACMADLNKDGITDLVFQNNAGQIAVWYMNANGTVASNTLLYSGGMGDWRVKCAADMNADGNVDLIFQNNFGQIVVWYMNGAGARTSFAFLYSGGLGDWKLNCAVDVNGDGNPDLVFQNTAGQLVAWYMNASGTRTGYTFLNATGLGDWKLKCTADINGDGNADLIFQNNFGQMAVWYMNGRSAKTSSAFLYTGGLGDWKVR